MADRFESQLWDPGDLARVQRRQMLRDFVNPKSEGFLGLNTPMADMMATGVAVPASSSVVSPWDRTIWPKVPSAVRVATRGVSTAAKTAGKFARDVIWDAGIRKPGTVGVRMITDPVKGTWRALVPGPAVPGGNVYKDVIAPYISRHKVMSSVIAGSIAAGIVGTAAMRGGEEKKIDATTDQVRAVRDSVSNEWARVDGLAASMSDGAALVHRVKSIRDAMEYHISRFPGNRQENASAVNMARARLGRLRGPAWDSALEKATTEYAAFARNPNSYDKEYEATFPDEESRVLGEDFYRALRGENYQEVLNEQGD